MCLCKVEVLQTCKKAAKQTAGDSGGGAKKKVGPGKARRERAATIRDLEARIATLAERLEIELEGVDVFSPLMERDDCPVCLTPLPLDTKDRAFMACCGNCVCAACNFLQSFQELKKLATFDDKAAVVKILEDSPCAFCRSARGEREIEKYKNLAENRGDTEAMGFLAHEYLNGSKTFPKDELTAMGWYVRAAETGDPTALVNVAVMCSQGTVLEKNVGCAKKLAVAAAKKGCVDAHCLLGTFYRNDIKKAGPLRGQVCAKVLDHWKFAAAGGSRNIMKDLETFRDQYGRVTEEEFDHIKEEFKKAAKLEWTEEREEYRRDEFRGRLQRMKEEKDQRARARRTGN